MAKTYNDLFKEINKALAKQMNTKVAQKVKKVELQHIEDQIYLSYEPRVYKRRYKDGGLKDIDNMKHKVIEKGNEVVLEVVNETRLKSDASEYLAPMLEEGYDSKSKPYNRPRPFTKGTYEELLESEQHIQALKEGLRSDGIKVE